MKISERDDKIGRAVKQIQNSGSRLEAIGAALEELGLDRPAGTINAALSVIGDECRAILGLLWDEPEPVDTAPPLQAPMEDA